MDPEILTYFLIIYLFGSWVSWFLMYFKVKILLLFSVTQQYSGSNITGQEKSQV
jgi:flagellar biosynthesis protein FliQ